MPNDVVIHIKGRDEASRVLDGVTKKAGGLGSALSGVTKIAGGFVMARGIMAAPGMLMDMTQAAADDAASVAKLQQAVENSGAKWEDYEGTLNGVIETAQKRGFTDDQARDALSLLTAQTGSAEEAAKRFALAQDLARGANIDVYTASKLLGKVTEENVNVLSRYGIVAREGMNETELFGMVQEKFGGQAETFANSTAGQMEAAKIQMGELKETIGYALLPVMTKLMQVIADNMPQIRAFIEEGIRRIKEVMEALAPVARALWDNFKRGLETIYPPLRALAEFIVNNKPVLIAAILAIGAAIVIALGPGELAVLAIVGLIALIGYLRDHWTEISNAIVGKLRWLKDSFFKLVGGLRDWLADNWKTIVNAALFILFPAAGGLFFIVTHFQEVKDRVGNILNALVGFFENAFERMLAPIQWVIDRIWQLIGAIRSIPSPGDVLGGLGGLLGKIPGFQAGGYIPSAQLAVVGERGPELVALPGGSRVYSNSESRGMGGGGQTINNYGRINNIFPNADPRVALRETDRLFRGA